MIEAMKRNPDDVQLVPISEQEFDALPVSAQEYIIGLEEKLAIFEHHKEAGSFFRGIFADRSTIPRNQQIVRHLQEYHFLLQNVHRVYHVVTGGMISRPGFHAEQVIEKFEDHVSALVEEEIEDRLQSGTLFRAV